MGFLLLTISSWAANLAVTATIQGSSVLNLLPTTVHFDNVQPGLPSTPKSFQAISRGTGSYMLTIAGTNFSGPATLAANVVQFRETGVSDWRQNKTTPQNLLNAPANANPDGDIKNFEIRLNFPPTALNGTYVGQLTITLIPQ